MRVITPPTKEPLSVEEASTFVRAYRPSEAQLLSNVLIPAARADFESFTGRAMMRQTLEVDTYPDCWPVRVGMWITVPRPPMYAITAVNLLDHADAATLVPSDGYRMYTATEPHGLAVVDPSEWPAVETLERRPRIRIRYEAGAEKVADVNPGMRHALLMWVATYFEHRTHIVMVGGGGGVARVPEPLRSEAERHCLYLQPSAE